jgi:ferrochelatase
MSDGILLTSYGTPDGLDDVERYLTHILGMPPGSRRVEGLRDRYAAVGGRTPLLQMTLRQAALLAGALGDGCHVQVGMRHSAPFIADGVRALVERGVTRGVVLPLAPQDSRLSVGGYHRGAQEALAALPGAPPFAYVHGFATHPLLLQAWADRVKSARDRLPAGVRQDAAVLFTAHSLPDRVLEWQDPYPAEVRRTCEGVAALIGLRRWEQCYQSAVGQNWLGPDVLDALDDLARRGVRGVIIAPIGFVSDHLETLYDLDIEAAARAARHGMAMIRCPQLNDDPRFIQVLADVARRALAGIGPAARDPE